MATGLTIAQFDSYFQANYDLLDKEARKYATSDLLHDVYISIRTKITGITFTSSVTGYFLRSLKNAFINSIANKPVIIDIEDIDESSIDSGGHDDFSNNQEYYNQLDNYARYLFKFVETRYTTKEQHVYKSYYLTDSTYKELAERTGYSYSTVEQYVQKINRDIKSNFNGWLKKELKKRSRSITS